MKKRILLVDDDPVTQEMVEKILVKKRYEVVTADEGQKGIDLYVESIIKNPFNLIILDVILPGMSGMEVLRRIRVEEESRGIKYGHGNSIPIIMLTVNKDAWLDAFDLGCDDFLVKPFNNAQLLERIKEKIK